MPRYEHQTSYFHKRSIARRVRALAFFVVLLIVAGALWIAVDLILDKYNRDGVTSEQTEVSIQADAVAGFRTEYFEFQAQQDWREILDEKKPNRFVYRRFDGQLVEYELTIEVNGYLPRSLAQQTTNRVLAVNPAGEVIVPVGPISDHCKTVYPDDQFTRPKMITMNEVSFLCNPNSTGYHVRVGVIGGDNAITLSRAGGEQAVYYIEFRSLKIDTDPNELSRLLATFKTR